MPQVAVTNAAVVVETERSQTWVSELAQELRWDEARAYGLLKSVLHGLRDRLSAEETDVLSALLPGTIRSMFLEGWQPSGETTRDQPDSSLEIRISSELVDPHAEDIGAAISAAVELLDRHLSKAAA
jgi:uncharacterized protein (DUF2267 family)